MRQVLVASYPAGSSAELWWKGRNIVKWEKGFRLCPVNFSSFDRCVRVAVWVARWRVWFAERKEAGRQLITGGGRLEEKEFEVKYGGKRLRGKFTMFSSEIKRRLEWISESEFESVKIWMIRVVQEMA